jgi:hypothetical protein
MSSPEECAKCGQRFAPTDAIVQIVARDGSGSGGHAEAETKTFHAECAQSDEIRQSRILYEGPFAGLIR